MTDPNKRRALLVIAIALVGLVTAVRYAHVLAVISHYH
jgi:hypothetical protein